MFVDSRGSALIRHQIKRFFQCVITAWHVNTSSVVCTLIDNGKLADQIATLLPTVVKQYIDTDWHLLWVEFHSDILKTNSLCTWVSANRKHHLMSKQTRYLYRVHWYYNGFPSMVGLETHATFSNNQKQHKNKSRAVPHVFPPSRSCFVFSTLSSHWPLDSYSFICSDWLMWLGHSRFPALQALDFSSYWLRAIYFPSNGHCE